MSATVAAEAMLIVIKRIGKWLLWSILILSVLIGSIVAYFNVQDYIDSRPRLITELKGIELGEKLSDVIFKKPGFVMAEGVETPRWGVVYENRQQHDARILILDGKVSRISYTCNEADDFSSINGIGCGAVADAIGTDRPRIA